MTIAHILSGLPTWEGHTVNDCHPELENGEGQPVVFYRLMSIARHPASLKGLTMLDVKPWILLYSHPSGQPSHPSGP